jgi:hypothetical protein
LSRRTIGKHDAASIGQLIGFALCITLMAMGVGEQRLAVNPA